MTDIIGLNLFAQADPAGNPLSLMPALIGAAVLFYLMILRPQQKREGALKTQVSGLKKNDRVITIGGIYGVVTNVQRDSDEVTIKVDEATNTKLRVTFNAIGKVISSDAADDKTTKSN